MHKYIILALFLTSCSYIHKPKFKVGDCVQFTSPSQERWEPNFGVDKILEVGKRKYRTLTCNKTSFGDVNCYRSELGFSLESYSVLVECPSFYDQRN